jgi:hypothetical protein
MTVGMLPFRKIWGCRDIEYARKRCEESVQYYYNLLQWHLEVGECSENEGKEIFEFYAGNEGEVW